MKISEKPKKTVHIVFQVLNFTRSQEAENLKLTDQECHLLIILSSYSGPKGIFPSIKNLRHAMHLSERPIQRLIKNLSEKKLIKIINYAGKRNHYELCNFVSTPADSDGGKEEKVIHNPRRFRQGTPADSDGGNLYINNKRNNLIKRVSTKLKKINSNFTCTEKHQNEAMVYNLKIEQELTDFVNYNKAHGKQAADWDAMFSLWLARGKKFNENQNPKISTVGVKESITEILDREQREYDENLRRNSNVEPKYIN